MHKTFNFTKPSVHSLVNGTFKILQHLLNDFQHVYLTILWTLDTIGLNMPAHDIVYKGTHQACTCSESTIETLEQRVKCVQS